MNVVVRTTGLTKRYRDVTALDGVDVELQENVVHGLLGRNGAGKTTLMQVLTGQALATGGRVEVFGEDPYENARVLGRTCLVKESQRYPVAFRVRHALRAAALVYPRWDQALADDLVADFDLPVDRHIKKLSRGMLSALGVITGLASRAPLTLFDEPYLGLDAAARQLFYDRLLADYAAHPRTIVLSTHLIDEVGDLLERVVLIDRGRILFDAAADDLLDSAVTVSGPAAAVEGFVAGRRELHREGAGGLLRVTVSGAAAHPVAGLRFEPVSLQQLVVRATRTDRRQPAAAKGDLR